MMMMRNVVLGLVTLLIGCTEPTGVTTAPGIEKLGIEQLVIDESDEQTTIQGLDASGVEVARLDLVHGQFTLTDIFRDQYLTNEVVGRKLDVAVRGETFIWETAGFSPTLQMPGPTQGTLMLAFLEDPSVERVLRHWNIGFRDVPQTEGESAYEGGQWGGNLISGACESHQCGWLQGPVNINMCGGQNNATDGDYTTAIGSLGYERIVAQCCPTIGGNSAPWVGVKTCPWEGSNSTCGSSLPCSACGVYRADNLSYCWTEHYNHGIYWNYGW